MSRDAWNEFSKTILLRYVLSYLCGTLYLDPSVSLKRILTFSVGGLFSLSTHALNCLSSSFRTFQITKIVVVFNYDVLQQLLVLVLR